MRISIVTKSGEVWSPAGSNELPCKLAVDVRMYPGGAVAIVAGQFSLAIPRGGCFVMEAQSNG